MKRDEHKIPLDTLVERFGTNLKLGHTQKKADELNTRFGDNKLTEKAKEPLWKKYIKEITSPFAIMLWVASIFCFVTFYFSQEDPSNLYLGIILIIVILITA